MSTNTPKGPQLKLSAARVHKAAKGATAKAPTAKAPVPKTPVPKAPSSLASPPAQHKKSQQNSPKSAVPSKALAGRSAQGSSTERQRGSRTGAYQQVTRQLPASEHQSRPRVFFALKVPAEVSGVLAERQKALRGNWRAVRPEQMHVTLAYLPSIDPARLDDLKRLGTRLAQEAAPLTIALRGTGYFPNEGSPRVWFVKVVGESAQGAGLDDLAAKLRAELSSLSLEVEEHFKAHITLARKKGPAPRLAPQIFDLSWQAPQMVLYRSHLQKTGPIYEVLSTFPFGGQEVTQTE